MSSELVIAVLNAPTRSRVLRSVDPGNGWAEAAGLGTTFLIGRMLVPQLESVTG
jgi:hypothetical protein